MLKYIFIVIMIIYLEVCLLSLGYKLIDFNIEKGDLNLYYIKNILKDGIFILIIYIHNLKRKWQKDAS